MTLPFYRADDDPGPSFVDLLARIGQGPRWDPPPGAQSTPIDITHGTTVVAIRCDSGVVMAGDRRATSGHLISHRTMEKVLPADRLSGVAFAGAAGPGMEMIKLFQLQLEHYEKVEGGELSLEGKANQLGQMVRSHLPAAMQGLAVVPLFAGFDTRRNTGRLFEYDVTGGRYEESDFAATGSGSLHAGTVIKLGYRDGLSVDEAIELSINALFQAADEDSATGGPDMVRGIFPVVATISADGFARLEDDDVSQRFRSLLDRMATTQGSTSLGVAPTSGGPPKRKPRKGGAKR
jgi:proteasome beta subunit